MKNIFSVALVASAFVSGCATLGDQSLAKTDQVAVDRYIVDGKTTMADVRAVFGDTNSKERIEDGEFWYYSAVNHKMVSVTIKTLGITFNNNGIVTSHRYGESSKNASMALN